MGGLGLVEHLEAGVGDGDIDAAGVVGGPGAGDEPLGVEVDDPPTQAGVTTATSVALAAMHLAMAAVVVPALAIPSSTLGRP